MSLFYTREVEITRTDLNNGHRGTDHSLSSEDRTEPQVLCLVCVIWRMDHKYVGYVQFNADRCVSDLPGYDLSRRGKVTAPRQVHKRVQCVPVAGNGLIVLNGGSPLVQVS